jgi:hypothetical protein
MESKPKVKRVTKKTKESVTENVVVTETNNLPVRDNTTPNVTETTESTPSKAIPLKEIRLTDIQVVDEITALNLMVSFLGLAQKRGAYTIDEASKIWECIKKFQRPAELSSSTEQSST